MFDWFIVRSLVSRQIGAAAATQVALPAATCQASIASAVPINIFPLYTISYIDNYGANALQSRQKQPNPSPFGDKAARKAALVLYRQELMLYRINDISPFVGRVVP
ncbi:hypothetical protein [Abyssibacter sp.]|uniref:hypothetical protein n=1 Tax=Abyssibacter sp. TaxID=2320200 RepID=UPI0025B9CF1B|nr:hypothetical protein [Abyssibacter sp.]MCK5860267.1 hypothetical protein [Abyssibacter sp.]